MGIISNSRERARRRRSPWNLLLLPTVIIPMAGLWLALVLLLQFLHAAIYPDQYLINSAGPGTVLTTVGPFVAVLIPAMLIGNILVRLIGPARKALDLEATNSNSTGFSQSQQALLSLCRVPTAIGLLSGFIGAVMPWQN